MKKGNMYQWAKPWNPLGGESKKCKYCGNDFYKRDFPKVFQRMVTCGSVECRKKHKKEWHLKGVCADCGRPVTNNAKRCKVCSLLGENNPFFGKTHRAESLVNIKTFKKGHIPYMKGRNHTEQAKLKNALAHTGENSSCWKGGISFEPYSPEFNKNLKNQIRIRDGYVCKICGNKGTDRPLDVHHVDYNKRNNEADNLVALCRRCHAITNYNIEFWKAYFYDLTEEILPSNEGFIYAIESLELSQQ